MVPLASQRQQSGILEPFGTYVLHTFLVFAVGLVGNEPIHMLSKEHITVLHPLIGLQQSHQNYSDIQSSLRILRLLAQKWLLQLDT